MEPVGYSALNTFIRGVLGGTGTPGNDLILGDGIVPTISVEYPYDDVLFGLDGNDTTRGGKGRDLIAGNAGNDYLDGGEGPDTIIAGSGNDYMFGGTGDDWIVPGLGSDTLVGDRDTDTLDYSATTMGVYISLDTGVPGDRGYWGILRSDDPIAAGDWITHQFEHVIGGEGNDTIIAGENWGTAWGMGGDDLLVAGVQHSWIDGGAGADTIDGTHNPYDVVSFLGAESDVLVRLWNGKIVTADPDYANDVLIAIEGADMGAGNDTVEGTPQRNSVTGGGGHDLFYGFAGDDYFDGRDGDDTGLSGEGNDLSLGGPGDDRLEGWAGNDWLDGGADNDVISGQDGNDVIMGGPGDDTLSDGPGQDTLYGDEGNDVVYAGAGDDNLDGGQGIDTLNFSAWALQVTVDLGAGTASGPAGADTISGFENVTGGSAGDLITGSAEANLLRGKDGADTLIGLGGKDTLVGGEGGDSLSGGELFDILAGQEGDDTLDGGAQGDYLRGGDGADSFVFVGAFGKDEIDDFGFGGADVAQIVGAPAGYTSFADFDVTGEGTIDAADAALTMKVALDAGGALLLSFDAAGDNTVTFWGIAALAPGDLVFV